MDTIDVNATGTSQNTDDSKHPEKLESVRYQGFDKEVYDYTDEKGEKWFQQVVAERMLGVRTRQFDLYCLCGPVSKSKFLEVGSNGEVILNELLKDGVLEEINSREIRLKENLDQNKGKVKRIAGDSFDQILNLLQLSQKEAVEKKRIPTGHYSYNFIKESDIFRIAKAKGKTIRLPLKDIPTTDANEKTLSRTDLTNIIDEEIKQRAPGVIKEYTDRIKTLETTNTNLTSELVTLVKEKSSLIDKTSVLEKEKNEVLNKKRKRDLWIIALGVILVIGGGAAGYFVYTTNSDNDRLYADRKQDKLTIVTINTDDLNQRTKVTDLQDELETVKKLIPTTQNAEINAVKKD